MSWVSKAKPLVQSTFLGFTPPVQPFWSEVGQALGLNNFSFPKKSHWRSLFWCHPSQACSGSCEFCWHQKRDLESRWKIHSLPNLNVSSTAEVSDASSDLKSVHEVWVGRKYSQSWDTLQLLLGFCGNHQFGICLDTADKTKGKPRPGIKHKEKFKMGANCINCRQRAWLKSVFHEISFLLSSKHRRFWMPLREGSVEGMKSNKKLGVVGNFRHSRRELWSEERGGGGDGVSGDSGDSGERELG